MLEKFTPNQRLLVAVALSFLFFIGYTAIFPPKAPNSETNSTQVEGSDTVALKPAVQNSVETNGSVISNVKTHSTDTLTTITAKEFTLKIDTLGRVSSVILSDAKHNGSDGKLSELIAATGAKPLQIRFADEALNDAAAKTPYTTNTNTQKLHNFSCFYALCFTCCFKTIFNFGS